MLRQFQVKEMLISFSVLCVAFVWGHLNTEESGQERGYFIQVRGSTTEFCA